MCEVDGDYLHGMVVWIQEDTERDYSQKVHRKNALVLATLVYRFDVQVS